MSTEVPSAGRAATPTVACLDFNQFLTVEAEWDALNAASTAPSPFVGHAWLKQWWRHFGKNMEFRALVAQVGDRWVAALPLCVRRRSWAGVPLGIVEIVGTSPVPTRGMGLSDRADTLVLADSAEAVAAFADPLLQLMQQSHVIDLKGCGQQSPTGELAQIVGQGRAVRRERSQSPYLALPPTWDEYLAGRSGNFRRQQRKFRRNLAKEGDVEIARLTPEDDPSSWFDTIVEINMASWKGARGTNLFRHDAIRAFMRDVLAEMGPRGTIDLNVLRVGGTAVAYEWCFEIAHRLFSYNSGFREPFARFAPGAVLTSTVIENGIGRGCTEYDLLRGAEEYKLRWTRTTRTEVEWVIPGQSLRGAGLGRALALKHRIKSSETLSDLADRVSGAFGRLFH